MALFTEERKLSRFETLASLNVLGPIVSGLTNKYGARIVVILGSIIAGLAFLLSIMSPNIYVMILLYGIIGGMHQIITLMSFFLT